jgi:hypothetical protein
MEKKEMILTIKEDLPIKYKLNMHLTDSFINRESVSFEIVRYLIDEVESNEKKELILNNLKFTSKTLKYIFGKKMTDTEVFKDFVILSIKGLISDGLLKTDNKSIKLTEEIINQFYNIE